MVAEGNAQVLRRARCCIPQSVLKQAVFKEERTTGPNSRFHLSKNKKRHKQKLSEVRADFLERRRAPPGGASGAAPGALRAP